MKTVNPTILFLVGLFFCSHLNAQQKKPAVTIPDSCLVTGKGDTLEIQDPWYFDGEVFVDIGEEDVTVSVYGIEKRMIITQILTVNTYRILGVEVGYRPTTPLTHRYVRVKLTCKKLRADILVELKRRDKTVTFSW